MVFYVCLQSADKSDDKVGDKVDFLGMHLDRSAATAGQWILLVIGLVFVLVIILLAYKYWKLKKTQQKHILMELKGQN